MAMTVSEYRKSLPSAKEANERARKLSEEKGTTVIVLGRDGKYHAGMTDEERAKGDQIMEVFGVLTRFKDLKVAPSEIIAMVDRAWEPTFVPALTEAVAYVIGLQAAWERSLSRRSNA